MTAERNVARIVRSWLREDDHESAGRVLQIVLDRLDTTPQRRSWPAWRSNRMNTYAKLSVAIAAVLVVAVVGYQFLPRNGSVGGQPTMSPSPAATLLARGNFTSNGATVRLDASGAGDAVTGTMTILDPTGDSTTALRCALKTADGRVLIGGDTTVSSSTYATKGTRTAIVLRPGSPVLAEFLFEDNPPAATCRAFLEGWRDHPETTDNLTPIAGTVDFGP